MEETKRNGKLYEKFEIIKKHTHNLEVAIVKIIYQSRRNNCCLGDPNDDDRKMPLAQLLTGTEIKNILSPIF